MKKKLIRYIYLLIVMVILFFVLNSCSSVSPPSTGIVTIDLDIGYVLGIDTGRPSDDYYIYMDGIYQGTMTGSGALTITDVPVGLHDFDAYNYMVVGISSRLYEGEDSMRELKLPINGGSTTLCSGNVSHLVETGINYVTIPVYCSPSIIMVE
jgi:hypothetical protein